jgi:hypothetical protein
VSFLLRISSGHLLNKDKKTIFDLLPDPDQSTVSPSLLNIANGGALNPLQFLHGSHSDVNEINPSTSTEGRRPLVKASNSANIRAALAKTSVLIRRAAWYLTSRTKLWAGSCIFHIFVAVLIYIVAGNVNTVINDTTAYIAISSIMLVFMSIQFLFFLHKTNEVFLKEHARGLYSYFAMWAVGSLPHYALKVLGGLLYSFVIYEAISLNETSDRFEFYLLIVSTVCVIGGVLSEICVFISPTVRSAYQTFPLLLFLLFYFSSLPVKPSTYVYWMKPWVPSASVFRWIVQATIQNEFDDDSETFLMSITAMNMTTCKPIFIPGTTTPRVVQLDTYPTYLSTFGFGGKTRSYCYGIVFLNLVIFRFISLLALRNSSHRYRGKRHLYTAGENE